MKRLRVHLAIARHDIERILTMRLLGIVQHAPRWLKRAFLVNLAVEATRPELIGGDAYAGPDGVDYERMWWALDDKLPPKREVEIGPWEDVYGGEGDYPTRAFAAEFVLGAIARGHAFRGELDPQTIARGFLRLDVPTP